MMTPVPAQPRRDLLHGERVAQVVEPGAADSAGMAMPMKPELGQLLHRLAGNVVLVPAPRVGGELLGGEVAAHVPDLPLLVGEVESAWLSSGRRWTV